MLTGPPGVLFPSLRPFQFPSLEHFDSRVNQVLARSRDVERLCDASGRWMQQGYASFRSFLATTSISPMFLGGDFNQQAESLALWRAWLLSRGVGRVTVRTYWGGLKAVCARIEQQDGMANPLRWIRPPRVGRVLPKALTRDVARTVLEFVENYEWQSAFLARRNAAMVGSMLLAGLRSGEVLRLRNEDVDEERGTFHIRQGKGRDGGKDRTSYMAPQLERIIAKYRRERVRLKPSAPTFFVG